MWLKVPGAGASAGFWCIERGVVMGLSRLNGLSNLWHFLAPQEHGVALRFATLIAADLQFSADLQRTRAEWALG